MAADMFLKLDGVSGEATADGMTDYMSIDSFSFGASNPTTVGPGSGGLTAGRVSVSSFNVTKRTESASCLLFSSCCAGKHFATGEVVLRKATGPDGGQQVFLKYSFTDVLVESIQWSGGGDEPSESLTLAFAKVTIEYSKQGADGSMSPSGNATWDLTKVKK